MLRVFARSAFAFTAFLTASSFAWAADLDGSYLRGDVGMDGGSAWDGLYIGASLGHTTFDGNAAGAAKGDVEKFLRGTATLIDLNASSFVDGFAARDEKLSYGGVIGHNWTWDGVVFGLEGTYMRSNLEIEGKESTRHIYKKTGDQTSTGLDIYQNFKAEYGGKVKITDMAALKGRMGYDAGPFMPFLTAGVAMIRGDSNHYIKIASGDTIGAPGYTMPSKPQYDEKKEGIYGFGMVGGFGVDYLLSDTFFIRGEYEITRIGNFDGAVQDFQTFKATAATKF